VVEQLLVLAHVLPAARATTTVQSVGSRQEPTAHTRIPGRLARLHTDTETAAGQLAAVRRDRATCHASGRRHPALPVFSTAACALWTHPVWIVATRRGNEQPVAEEKEHVARGIGRVLVAQVGCQIVRTQAVHQNAPRVGRSLRQSRHGDGRRQACTDQKAAEHHCRPTIPPVRAGRPARDLSSEQQSRRGAGATCHDRRHIYILQVLGLEGRLHRDAVSQGRRSKPRTKEHLARPTNLRRWVRRSCRLSQCRRRLVGRSAAAGTREPSQGRYGLVDEVCVPQEQGGCIHALIWMGLQAAQRKVVYLLEI
jgi:hypothetical protein